VTDWIIPFLCGLGASILSAWGVGGGTLLLLVMTLFLDVDQRTAQGINLLFFLPTAASALVCHARGGYLDKPTLKSAVPLAVAAALAGAWIATNLDVRSCASPSACTCCSPVSACCGPSAGRNRHDTGRGRSPSGLFPRPHNVFSTLPRRADTPLFRPGPGALPASKGAACGAGRALVLYSTGSFRVSVTSIRSPSRQISMVT